jgi:hypothetical protein
MSYDEECYALFNEEARAAYKEVTNLMQLQREAEYYNSDIAMAARSPVPLRRFRGFWWVRLFGQRHSVKWIRGQKHEWCEFPCWHEGPTSDAPTLPPKILAIEVELAQAAYLRACVQVQAPYDWAPGGYLYHRLAQSTMVGRTFSSA